VSSVLTTVAVFADSHNISLYGNNSTHAPVHNVTDGHGNAQTNTSHVCASRSSHIFLEFEEGLQNQVCEAKSFTWNSKVPLKFVVLTVFQVTHRFGARVSAFFVQCCTYHFKQTKRKNFAQVFILKNATDLKYLDGLLDYLLLMFLLLIPNLTVYRATFICLQPFTTLV